MAPARAGASRLSDSEQYENASGNAKAAAAPQPSAAAPAAKGTPARSAAAARRVRLGPAGLSSPSDALSPLSQRLVGPHSMRGGRVRSLRSALGVAAPRGLPSESESSSEACESPAAAAQRARTLAGGVQPRDDMDDDAPPASPSRGH